jgi:uncharacterized phage protein (predicted DNA packaging)
MAILDDVKAALRVTHNSDDGLLSRLIESATMEYARFVGIDLATSNIQEINVESDALQGIVLMIQADYDGDPLMRDKYRAAAEALWMPYAENDRTAL